MLLKPKRNPQRGSAEAHILNQLVALLVIGKVPIRQLDVPPAQAVTDPEQRLPGQFRRAGSRVEVVGYRPVALAQLHAAADADDCVHHIFALRDAPRFRKNLRSAEWPVSGCGELPIGRGLEPEVTKAANDV